MQIMDKYVQAGEALAWKENEVLDLTKQVIYTCSVLSTTAPSHALLFVPAVHAICRSRVPIGLSHNFAESNGIE